MELQALGSWVGCSRTRQDLIHAGAMAGLAATLDRDDLPPLPGTALPPLWHWIYFLPQALQREIGLDGHPRRGGFLPPVDLPRRMWAGGRLQFHQPLRAGETATRISRIVAVDGKQGRSGSLVFVTVHHEIVGERGPALTEEQDIVYRDSPQPGAAAAAAQPAPTDEQFSRRIVPDPVLLFRYSALTFNGHRIHYDRRYATEVEGYPGLVVHGPLIATLLADVLRRERPGATMRRFDFKAVRPTFDLAPFEVCGRADGAGRWRLWARDAEGAQTMSADAETD